MWQHTWQPKHGRLEMFRMHLLYIMWHLVLIVFLLLGGGAPGL